MKLTDVLEQEFDPLARLIARRAGASLEGCHNPDPFRVRAAVEIRVMGAARAVVRHLVNPVFVQRRPRHGARDAAPLRLDEVCAQ